jgi:uncharacterized RDD family membrane protein YckC
MATRTHIDIPTAQNVIISYPLANFGERLIAMAIDLFLYGLLLSLLMWGGFSLIYRFNLDANWVVMILQLMPVWIIPLYFGLQETLNRGRTLGKIALNIQAMKVDGGQLTWSDMFMRCLCLLPDLFFSIGAVGSVLINTTPRRQRLGDMAAGTIVVKSATNQIMLKDLLNIQTTANYTPMYPQVRNLTEKDMVFIKQVITRAESNRNAMHQDVVVELTERLREVLGLELIPENDRMEFLRTLLRDYVVLTR